VISDGPHIENGERCRLAVVADRRVPIVLMIAQKTTAAARHELDYVLTKL